MERPAPGDKNSTTSRSLNYRSQQEPISDPTASAATTRGTSRSTVTTILSHCTVDPYAPIGYAERRDNAGGDLIHRKQDHPDLINAFFGEDTLNDVLPIYESIKAELYSNGRWEDMALSGTTMLLPDNVAERESNRKFLTLLENIQGHFTCSEKRGFRDTQYSHYHLRNGDAKHWLSPDITFWGKDTDSFPETSENSSPYSNRASFEWCIAILEGKLDKTRKDEDDDQLASYIREIFSAQFNRRFIPSFIFTQSKLKFFLFDRSGVLRSDEFNYHNEPKKFVGIVRSLLKWDEGRLGFDHTITREEEDQWFITTCPMDEDGNRMWQRYIVIEPLFHSTALVGDCPICWLVKKEDEYTGDYYLIKDAWVFGGSSNEGALLQRVSSQRGVAQILYHEDVQIAGSDDTDSIFNNRPRRSSEDNTTNHPTENRVHSRIVMRLRGRAKPLEKFSSREELLVALRDAIAGILHRDVSPFCILIQSQSNEGDRGILFDLHCAVDTKSIPSDADSLDDLFPREAADRLGSRAFQSYHVLCNEKIPEHAHYYIYDLESFYYTLCYMVILQSDPERSSISRWFRNFSRENKIDFLHAASFPIPVPDFLGDPVRTLLENLHKFTRVRALRHTLSLWTPEAVKDYDIFLGHIDEAITAIYKENHIKKRPPPQAPEKPQIKKAKTQAQKAKAQGEKGKASR